MTSRRSSGSSRADERGRADQIAEHHRQLPAFGIGWRRCIARRRRRRGGGHRGAERGDRIEQLAAMASKHHAEILQILRRQLRQHVPIDLVVAERRHISFKAQTPQPRRYVHAVILGSEERQPLMDEDIPLPVDLPAAALK